MSYLTNTQQEFGRRTSASATTMHGYNRSSIPRSQGCSREASPSRVHGTSDNKKNILFRFIQVHGGADHVVVAWHKG